MGWNIDTVGFSGEYSANGLTSTVTRAGVTNVTARLIDGRTYYSEQNGKRKQTYKRCQSYYISICVDVGGFIVA